MQNTKKTRKNLKHLIILTAISAISLTGVSLVGSSVLRAETIISIKEEEAVSKKISEVVSDVYPGLVGIYTPIEVDGETGYGYGSGFIYKMTDKEVFVMTNAHVAVGEKQPTVYFSNNSKTPATLVGADKNRDVAIVKFSKEKLPKDSKVVEMGDSDTLKLGESVIAIGNPLDPEFFGTTTSGVVSGKSRLLPGETTEDSQPYYQELIQIDAAINHGNSGGPLFNLAGQVVGINSSGISSDANNEPVSNFGFAIPTSNIKIILADLEAGVEPGIASIGIESSDVNYNPSESIQSEPITGYKIPNVKIGSDADDAGLKKDDIITKFDDVEINNAHDLTRQLMTKKKDESTIITILRGDHEETVKLTYTNFYH